MAEVKDKVKTAIKATKSRSNAVSASLSWFKDTLSSRKDDSVTSLKITERFKAGKVYRFGYYPITPNLPFYDMNPIILSLGQIKYKNTIAERGINLNYLPHDIRVYILDKVSMAYKNTILQESKRNSTNATMQKGLPLSFASLKTLFSVTGADYAIRNYSREGKRDVTAIAYESWDRAALIETDYFKYTNLGEVHTNYYKYIKNK